MVARRRASHRHIVPLFEKQARGTEIPRQSSTPTAHCSACRKMHIPDDPLF
jgi:hypothetical protein